jgi:hypothetical protein
MSLPKSDAVRPGDDLRPSVGWGALSGVLACLRTETFGVHHREQAAEVMDPLDLRCTQPHRLGKRVAAYFRQGARFWEQDGSGHKRAGTPKRGDRSRIQPLTSPDVFH